MIKSAFFSSAGASLRPIAFAAAPLMTVSKTAFLLGSSPVWVISIRGEGGSSLRKSF
jgi:hypothetical protein